MNVPSFDLFLSQALSLPVEQRSRLATVLIDSLDFETDTGLSPAWKAEILRRACELDDGSVKPMSLDGFRAYIEERVA